MADTPTPSARIQPGQDALLDELDALEASGQSLEEREKPQTVTDEEVDAVVYEFKGDPREAIRALLHDLKMLAEDSNRKVSKGYVRGQLWGVRKFG